ncbi:sensor histidine kinase [Geodermatophilus sp. SYSU D01180]
MTRQRVLDRRPAGTGLPGTSPGEWVPAVVLAGLCVAEALLGSASRHPVADAAAGGVAALTLATRRRAPVLVLVVACGLLLLPAALDGASQSAAQAAVIAVGVYSCGRHGREPRALLGIPVGSAAVLLQLAWDPLATVASSWAWALNPIWIYALGAWVRQQAGAVERTRAEAEARAAAAAAEHRVRIAREVHDVLAHDLVVMLVQAGVADELLESDPDRAHRALAHVQDTGRSAMRDVRAVLEALRGPAGPGGGGPRRPVVERAEPVVEQVEPVVEQIEAVVGAVRAAGVPLSLVVSGEPGTVDPATGAVALRVVQEALTNVLRHAGRPPTQVRLVVADGRLAVQVHNDPGPGPARHRSGGRGHGLRGMRERVAAVGGVFSAGPDPTGGFTVAAELPLRGEAGGAG